MQRDSMEFDVVIVGAGPSGLSAAIHLAQLSLQEDSSITICVVEKGSEVGSHILSGAILEPRSLDELLPDWKQLNAPIHTAVSSDHFQFLTKKHAITLPTPPSMHNQGNYIISLGDLCRWLAEQAEQLGIEIFPGFAASEILYEENGAVRGIATGDMGISKDEHQTDNFQPGVELIARQTLFAEGCRGSLSKQIINQYQLRKDAEPQTYGIGLKELWEIPSEMHHAGSTCHTIGWPLDNNTYGGSFIYHLENNQISIGFVIGLDYQNPFLDPFEEFQQFKNHPAIRPLLEKGKRISYGARALSEGGYQSIPKLTFPGGCLIGDSAGFLNVAKIKGTHTAMKSGMLAAEAVFKILQQDQQNEAVEYTEKLRQSWLWDELKQVRNIRPGFQKGLWRGLYNAAIETYITRGKGSKTLKHHEDHSQLQKAAEHTKINYPKPDGIVSFDRLSSVYLSGTNHEENQPAHLQLKDNSIPITINLADYDAPEQRYCPAGVYEIIIDSSGSNQLQINAQNCLHCKTCDIKDPTQNINWVPPEGGGGPNYPNM
ncbi:MAG: electron transfer flavoprotein-ubiquinone oxidoreductase [Gammaproteobacteria bacterium]|nr:electron transfer flavoprotein-ubiquinone oxidoreductase [Gammaproteobacteria bacterium]MBT3723387.1 electron transfer flavoprotein-ubiquinone oxidoreductase [Gammaproteobacteria bacterium]MBT4076431.1 electron transfer flavoprotein-ubiquinone oxidoreductase [Gammaproteobacteria bacterium]MBT4196367.1 electron transfer flavoprotein-ubiquinone oxidoreductase [Gammaproteobacteria bacterium]MBT4452371.1 electron transfer flavoprotein-ubiquinone oxidoreductase [Gammaproteobacteria bacterium]